MGSGAVRRQAQARRTSPRSIDYNKIQSAGPTREIQDLEPLLDKWRAFNFAAVEVDGHDVEALRNVFRRAAARRRPAERHHLPHRQGQGHRVCRERCQLAPQIEDRQDVVARLYAALE